MRVHVGVYVLFALSITSVAFKPVDAHATDVQTRVPTPVSTDEVPFRDDLGGDRDVTMTGRTVALAGSLPSRLMRTLATDAALTQFQVPEQATGIGPGSNIFIEMEDGLYGCTANFLWRATTGTTYLGTAGHCFLPSDRTATHGPDADWDAVGVRVQVCLSECSFGGQTGFILSGDVADLGNIAYARQAKDGVEIGNDFGLIEIPEELLPLIRTELPVWGGPRSSTPALADGPVCLYGNGMVVGESWPTMARAGHGLMNYEDGSWDIAIASGIGDSGAAVVSCAFDGDELRGNDPVGILTHGISAVVTTVPSVAYGTSTARAIQMVQDDVGVPVRLLTG